MLAPRDYSQHTRNRLVLLGDVRTCSVCLAVFVALSIGVKALQSGAGLVGALLIGTAGGALMLVAGQVAVAITRSLALRIAIATAFSIPAAVAGYHVVFAMSQIGVPTLVWREVFACLGAVCIGVTSWTRMMVLPKTRAFEPGRVVENPY